MNNVRNYRRGDIYLSKTGPRIGNRCSARAVLLLQNDADEFYSTSIFAVPIAMKPSPFPAPSDDVRVYLTSMSLVQYSCAGAVDKRTLADYVGTLDDEQLEIVRFILQKHYGLFVTEAVEAP
mgnify:FL=1